MEIQEIDKNSYLTYQLNLLLIHVTVDTVSVDLGGGGDTVSVDLGG